MKIFFPLDGTPGCRVVVGQGFLDGFNDDYPDSNLKELTGATFIFDGEFQLKDVHLRNADLKKLAGPYMGKLIAIVRDWAQDQKAPTISGFRPAFKLPWTLEPIPAQEIAAEPPPPAESEPQMKSEPNAIPANAWSSDPDYDYIRVPGRAVVTRRRKAS